MTPSGVELVEEAIPDQFHLSQNYPNPFNPSTLFDLFIPTAGFVELTIHNAIGQQVAVLHKGHLAMGVHRARWDASPMPSGVYVARLSAGNTVQTRRIVLLK
jgi:hypothetical protein